MKTLGSGVRLVRGGGSRLLPEILIRGGWAQLLGKSLWIHGYLHLSTQDLLHTSLAQPCNSCATSRASDSRLRQMSGWVWTAGTAAACGWVLVTLDIYLYITTRTSGAHIRQQTFWRTVLTTTARLKKKINGCLKLRTEHIWANFLLSLIAAWWCSQEKKNWATWRDFWQRIRAK